MRPELPPLPERMRDLPVSPRGYPVPYFVAWVNGEPDFRVMDGKKLNEALRWKLCWLCGQRMLGRHVAFVIGPMCAVNRTSAEPPSHRECAEYAVRACPFLTRPDARRRETNVPDGVVDPAGEMLRRNPKASLIWITKNPKPVSDDRGGILFNVGAPVETSWWFEGRPATRAEVLESFETGLPILEEMARKDGPEVVAVFERMKATALTLVPA